MKVILLKDVRGTGRKYDVKNVADGYAMNYLLPNKLAELATAEKISQVEQHKREQADVLKIEEDLLHKNLEALKEVTIEIKEKTNDEGRLFKGVAAEAIIQALKEQKRLELQEDAIVLEKPIKETGEFEIPVEAHGKKSSFKLIISSL